MAKTRVEVLVEPFKENDPGPHVYAVLDALERAGLHPDMGPFATTAEGNTDVVAAALGDVVRSGAEAGATAIQIRIVINHG